MSLTLWGISIDHSTRMPIFTWLYCPTIVFAKMAVLLQSQRMFAPTPSGAIYWSLTALQVVNTLFYIACLIVAAFPCNPRQKLWDPLIAGTCVNGGALILASAVFNLYIDIAMLLVPVFAIMRLHIARAKKFGIGAIFGVGIL